MSYTNIRILIETGAITRLPQILEHMPVDQLAADLRMPEPALQQLLANPGTFNMTHIHAFSELLDVEMDLIMKMAADQFLETIK